MIEFDDSIWEVLFVILKGPTWLLSLFLPSLRRFGVIRSIASKSEVQSPRVSGRSLMQFEISDESLCSFYDFAVASI